MINTGIIDNGAALAEEKKDNTAFIDYVLAEVNGKPVTTSALIKGYSAFLVMSGQPDANLKGLTIDSFLDRCIRETVLLQAAEKAGIKVKQSDVEEEKKLFLTNNNLTDEQFSKELKRFGITMEDVHRYIENNLIIDRFGNEKFNTGNVSDKEARDFYDNNKELYNSPEKITARHILICHKDSQDCSSSLTKEEAKGLAENIRKIVTPENFISLTKRYSPESTAEDGGDLGVITRGSAEPAFEKAAFSLHKGEISDVVETVYGYHIIYVTGKQEARSITFEEAKEAIKKRIKKNRTALMLNNYLGILLKNADIKKYTVPDNDALNKFQNTLNNKTDISPEDKIKTFWLTSKGVCRNSKGQPVILLFSEAGCPHCEWISETFDNTVREYVANGLIEAHHYDIHTKDDLLTPEVEKEIPEKYFKIYMENSPGSVPYFNFGCMYHRMGNGYQKQDDLFAEETEMRAVIESVLKY